MVDRLKRLQRLLRLRERRERLARQQLALGLREDEQRRLALAEAEGHLAEAREWWSREAAAGMGAGRWSLLQGYLTQRQRGVARRERLVEEWQPRLRAARADLSRAAREREAMARWGERLARRLRLEEEREERRVLDEIGLRETLRRAAPEHGEEHGEGSAQA